MHFSFIFSSIIYVCAASTSFQLILGSILAIKMRKPNLAILFLCMGLAGILIGLFLPPMLDAFVQAQGLQASNLTSTIVDVLLTFLTGLVTLAFLVGYGFLPTIIAFRKEHEKRELIAAVNALCPLLPIIWLGLLIYAMTEHEQEYSPMRFMKRNPSGKLEIPTNTQPSVSNAACRMSISMNRR